MKKFKEGNWDLNIAGGLSHTDSKIASWVDLFDGFYILHSKLPLDEITEQVLDDLYNNNKKRKLLPAKDKHDLRKIIREFIHDLRKDEAIEILMKNIKWSMYPEMPPEDRLDIYRIDEMDLKVTLGDETFFGSVESAVKVNITCAKVALDLWKKMFPWDNLFLESCTLVELLSLYRRKGFCEDETINPIG